MASVLVGAYLCHCGKALGGAQGDYDDPMSKSLAPVGVAATPLGLTPQWKLRMVLDAAPPRKGTSLLVGWSLLILLALVLTFTGILSQEAIGSAAPWVVIPGIVTALIAGTTSVYSFYKASTVDKYARQLALAARSYAEDASLGEQDAANRRDLLSGAIETLADLRAWSQASELSNVIANVELKRRDV